MRRALGADRAPVDAGQGLERQLRWQERLGDATYLYFEGGGEQDHWVLRADGRTDLAVGSRLALTWGTETFIVPEKASTLPSGAVATR